MRGQVVIKFSLSCSFPVSRWGIIAWFRLGYAFSGYTYYIFPPEKIEKPLRCSYFMNDFRLSIRRSLHGYCQRWKMFILLRNFDSIFWSILPRSLPQPWNLFFWLLILPKWLKFYFIAIFQMRSKKWVMLWNVYFQHAIFFSLAFNVIKIRFHISTELALTHFSPKLNCKRIKAINWEVKKVELICCRSKILYLDDYDNPWTLTTISRRVI